MAKRNILLFALVLVQVVIIGYLYRPGQESNAHEIEFFPGVQPDKISRVTITNVEQDSVILKRAEQGWIIEPAGFPANAAKVDSLLGSLTSLRSKRLVTRTKSSQIRLKVGDEVFERKIELITADEKSHIIYLGSSPGQNSVHVRLDGAEEVFLADGLTPWNAPAGMTAWWQTQYVEMAPDELMKVKLANSSGSFEIRKGEDGRWRLEGSGEEESKSLSQEKVKEFLTRAGRISLTKYLSREEDESYALAKPEAELGLESKQKSVLLKIGQENKETKDHVAKASDSPFYVRIGSYAVKDILEKKLKDLLEETHVDSAESKAQSEPMTGPNPQKE